MAMNIFRFKLLILIGISTFLLSSDLGAQSRLTDLGIKGGFAFSRLNVDNARNETSRNGYNIGFYGDLSFHNKFRIESGVLFSAKGANFETRSRLGLPSENKVNINYLSVPIQFKYDLIKYLSVGGGVYASHLLSVNFTRETNSSIDLFTISKDNLRNVDAGFIAGVTFSIDAIGIAYEYTNSFSNQFTGELGTRFLGGGKNSTSQISLSFNFLYKQDL